MSSLKLLTVAILATSGVMFLTGCNTVQGAFQGAARDTHAVANELQLNNPPKKHSVSKPASKKAVKATTTHSAPSAQ